MTTTSDTSPGAGGAVCLTGTTERVQNAVTPGARRGIPALDGIRGVSISLVLVFHATMTVGMPRSPLLSGWVDWGALGVQVFFVLSGYLITRLLLNEADRTGTISLRLFYLRRLFRIFPPFYCYLVGVAVLASLGMIDQSARGIAYAAVYLTNYVSDSGWFVGHSWSLAVEEQFYLLWPLALLMAGRRRGWMVAAVVAGVGPLLRVAVFHTSGGVYGFNHRFETTADLLAIGCLLAYFGPLVWSYVEATHLPGSVLILGGVTTAVFASGLAQHPHVYLLAGQTVVALGIALVILVGVNNPECVLGRVLNSRVLKSIGTVSYSLYLWQQLFLGPGASAMGLQGLTGALCGIALSVVAAYVSYIIVERPSLVLRDAILNRRRRSGHAVTPA